MGNFCILSVKKATKSKLGANLDLHSKQKVGQNWSKLVALGQWAKLVTNDQVTNYKLYVQLVT